MNAIVRRSPFETLVLADPFFGAATLWEEVDRLVGEMWDSWEPVVFSPDFASGLEIFEDKDGLVVKAELPGVKKEDFEVSLEDGMLTIEAEKKSEDVSEDIKYYARERRYGKYTRSVSLPFPIAEDKIAATLEHGVLEVRLPKAEEAKPKRIEVK